MFDSDELIWNFYFERAVQMLPFPIQIYSEKGVRLSCVSNVRFRNQCFSFESSLHTGYVI